MVSSISTKKIFWNNSRGTSVPFLFRRITSKQRLDFFGKSGIIMSRGENNEYLVLDYW